MSGEAGGAGAGADGGSGARGARDARDRILGRVRAALESRQRVGHPGAFPGAAPEGTSAEDGPDPVEEFAEVFRAAGGEVVRFDAPDDAARWLAGLVAGLEAGGSGVAVAPDVPEPLRPPGRPVAPRAAALGVSMARAAGADTGSIVLVGDAGRAVQILPPVHVVWVPVPVVAATLEAALRVGVGEGIPRMPRALALHSGPSKSADIGQIVVTGVHGPGRVVAALLDFEPARAGSETEHGEGP